MGQPQPPAVPPPSAAYMAKWRGAPVEEPEAGTTRGSQGKGRMSLRELQDSELKSLHKTQSVRDKMRAVAMFVTEDDDEEEVPCSWGEALGLTLHKPELMRSTNSHAVLRIWSTMFSSVTEDPHAMYAMSKVVKKIDTFVSHSWRTPGWARALALAWYMARRRLFVAAIVLPLVWAVIARHFDLRVVAWSLPHGASKTDIMVVDQGWTSIVVPAAFVLVAWSVTRTAGKIYLDRCCMCHSTTRR